MKKAFLQGKDIGLAACSVCHYVVRLKTNLQYCPRCHSHVCLRKMNSLNRTWAFLISALIMYIPANSQPVMVTSYLGSESADTILGGVVYFVHHGEWPLALIIFIASVLIPLFKMMSLVYLVVSVQRHSIVSKKQRTRLYRLTEVIGRWSMVDVFVVALMVALVQLGALASIIPGLGAAAFSAVVILTMFAAMAFDPRLIWDQKGNKH